MRYWPEDIAAAVLAERRYARDLAKDQYLQAERRVTAAESAVFSGSATLQREAATPSSTLPAGWSTATPDASSGPLNSLGRWLVSRGLIRGLHSFDHLA